MWVQFYVYWMKVLFNTVFVLQCCQVAIIFLVFLSLPINHATLLVITTKIPLIQYPEGEFLLRDQPHFKQVTFSYLIRRELFSVISWSPPNWVWACGETMYTPSKLIPKVSNNSKLDSNFLIWKGCASFLRTH
jgi:hypothetical protein